MYSILFCFCIKMAEFTAVFVGEEDGSVDIKEECVEEKDPLSTLSQSTKGKQKNRGHILKWIKNIFFLKFAFVWVSFVWDVYVSW